MIDTISAWIQSCDRANHIPDDNNFIPSRLLYIGDSQSHRVRLISGLGKKLSAVRYVALSHRWGRPDQKQPTGVTFAATTEENIGEIEPVEGLGEWNLPQTFRDAIVITRSLGLEYIWIDSLCILQRTGRGSDAASQEDWERECKLMEQVYHSAYLTIAASCAEHRFDGFLKPRKRRDFLTMYTEDGSQFHVCEVIDNFDSHVNQGELNNRAWVLQERALSRRTLHFTDTQVYWECGEGVRCETFTKMKNQKASFLGDSNFPHSTEAYKEGRTLQHYQDLYERYSSLGLSFAKDRYKAIAGLEMRLTKAMKSAGGYGIFESSFHRGLLWHRELSTPKLERINLLPELPSWSWTGFSGAIRYMNVPLGDIERNNQVISPFRGCEPGRVYMDCYPGTVPEIAAPLRTLSKPDISWLILDNPNRRLVNSINCIIIGKSIRHQNEKQKHYALIVSPCLSNADKEIYERVGVAYLLPEELEPEKTPRLVRIR